MPRYRVTLNEIIAKTYELDADNPDHAIKLAKGDAGYPSDEFLVDDEWIDYWGEPNIEEDVVET